jgi:hypothetical protein
MNLTETKFFIGPMSKNIVDAILQVNNDTPNVFAFIPSRRQVEFDGGYVNNWTTQTFSEYVNKKMTIQRDHGGPLQGKVYDLGFHSFGIDAKHFDIIHVDPWKLNRHFSFNMHYTVDYIKYIHNINPNIYYEIGTEEAIKSFSPKQLETFLHTLRIMLSKDIFDKIKYAVVQSGVGLDVVNRKNIGNTCLKKLEEMISVCNSFGIMTKEHNGDYLSLDEIKQRFNLGLSAINIAPEFGQIETLCYLKEMTDREIDQYFHICYKSGKWKKWVPLKFDPIANKIDLIITCGHYVLSNPEFLDIKPNINDKIIVEVKRKLQQLLGICNAE